MFQKISPLYRISQTATRMIRVTYILVLSVLAMLGSRSESALTYRYRPLGGELKFARQTEKVGCAF